MLRLVFAAVTVDHHGGGALFEGLAEGVDAGDGDGNRLHDARTAPLLCSGVVNW